MSWSHLSALDVAPHAWRNGGGLTRELLAWPRPEDWALRISVADIEASGPFSAFPGVARHFAVLQGAGVRLRFAHEVRELRPGDALFGFDGGAAPQCELLEGFTRDFNLMHRMGQGRLRWQPATQPLTPPAGTRWFGLFTQAGGQLRHGDRAMALAPMSLAWCEAPAAQRCVFSAQPEGQAAWWIELLAEAELR